MRFVESANFPEDLEYLLLGQRYLASYQGALRELGLEPVGVPDNPQVDPRLAGHADLSCFHAGGSRLYLAQFLRDSLFSKQLQNWGGEIHYSEGQQGRHYPQDAQFNACAVGRFLLCNKITVASEILREVSAGRTGLFCRQGYTRCNVCLVSEDAIITSDSGIADCASPFLDILRIRPGYVDLPGFSYGFLGGASFKLSQDTLAFTGSLQGHPDRDSILSFLKIHRVNAVFLSNGPLMDIGGAIPLIEKDHSSS